jgi:hypothetical protein
MVSSGAVISEWCCMPGCAVMITGRIWIGGCPVDRVGCERRLHGRRVVSEVGSGLDGKRLKLARVLSDRCAMVIVVEHRDRLAGSGWGSCTRRWVRAGAGSWLSIPVRPPMIWWFT